MNVPVSLSLKWFMCWNGNRDNRHEIFPDDSLLYEDRAVDYPYELSKHPYPGLFE